MHIPESGCDIHEMVAPQEGDIPIAKYHPSAFFGTSLSSYLIERQIDTLVVTGATTSGCVRGTVVDASSLNYKVVVAEDAVFDRVQVSHAVNLFDMYRSEEHTSELQSRGHIVCRLLLEKKNIEQIHLIENYCILT